MYNVFLVKGDESKEFYCVIDGAVPESIVSCGFATILERTGCQKLFIRKFTSVHVIVEWYWTVSTGWIEI